MKSLDDADWTLVADAKNCTCPPLQVFWNSVHTGLSPRNHLLLITKLPEVWAVLRRREELGVHACCWCNITCTRTQPPVALPISTTHPFLQVLQPSLMGHRERTELRMWLAAVQDNMLR